VSGVSGLRVPPNGNTGVYIEPHSQTFKWPEPEYSTVVFGGQLRCRWKLDSRWVLDLTDGLTGVGRNPSGSYSSRDVVMFTAGGGDALLVTAGRCKSQRFNSCDNGESAYSIIAERDRTST
jgi:hypothetical protein